MLMRIFNLLLLTLVLTAITGIVKAQYLRGSASTGVKLIPGLLRELKQPVSDIRKLELCIQLSSIYLFRPEEEKSHLDSAMVFANQAKTLASSLHLSVKQQLAMTLIAGIYIERPQRKMGLKLLKEINDNNIAEKDYLLASYYFGQFFLTGEKNSLFLDSCSRHYEKALFAYIKKGNADASKLVFREMYNIYQDYGSAKDYSGQKSHFEKLIALTTQYPYLMSQSEIYVSWTSSHVNLSNYKEALAICLKGLAKAEKNGNERDRALLFLNLGNIYRLTGKPAQSNSYYLKVLESGVDISDVYRLYDI